MATVQEKWFAFQANRNLSRSGGASSSFSDAAQAVLDKLTNPTEAEQEALATYIDAETANGNQALKDYELIFPLGSTNGLVDLVGTRNATNSSATFSVNGIAVTGGSHVDSNFIPVTHAVNAGQDDMYVAAFIKVVDVRAANKTPFVSESTANDDKIWPRLRTGTLINYWINSTSAGAGNVAISNESIVGVQRTASNAYAFFIDGASQLTDTDVSTALPDRSFKIGAKVEGTSAGETYEGTISSFLMSAADGFDEAANNTNLRALLTSLGTI